MGEILAFTEADATASELVGAKAAWLARASRLGLPVLPGLVVPIAASAPAMASGRRALTERGPATARSAVTTAAIDPALAEALQAVATLGQRLVVRSSSRWDDDGAWSGAFASFGDIEPAEVGVAVRGCWASVFSPDAMARSERLAVDDGASGLGVLIQRQLVPDAGGWARVHPDSVEVAATRGSPAALLAGWETGSRASIERHGDVHSVDGSLPIAAAALSSLVEVVERAHAELGTDRIEWACEAGRIVVLQLSRTSTDDHGARHVETPLDGFEGTWSDSLARLLVGRRGPLATQLLTPWAASFRGALPGAALMVPDGAVTLSWPDVLASVDVLNEAVASSCGLSVATLRDSLAGGALGDARPRPLSRTELVAAGRVVASAEAVATELVKQGQLPSVHAIWWQSLDWLDSVLAGRGVGAAATRPAATRPAADRWDDLLAAVVQRRGEARPGTPASAGRAVARATRIDDPYDDGARWQPGDVLICARPIPALAPLLWEAAGLVALSGNPAAHLCEVARSIHLPAVVGADLADADGAVVALDGLTGGTWRWGIEGRRPAVGAPIERGEP